VAWHLETTGRQGLFPQVAEAEPQRPAAPDFAVGAVDNRAHALAQPREQDNSPIGAQPRIL
jgi:hypothetical protein